MKVSSLYTLIFIFISIILLIPIISSAQDKRPREYGITIGVFNPGTNNAITDVAGVKVGHKTLVEGDNIRTGVTAILPHGGNIFQQKVPAAIYIGNGFGKLMGYSQVEELGYIETPIILTNTLSVPTAANGVISYILQQEENGNVRSVNAVVGETNDGYLNDIRGRHVGEDHVLEAIANAQKEGIVDPILVGDEKNIRSIAKKIKFDLEGIQVVDIENKVEASKHAVKLVRDGEAEVLMKGLVSTGILMKCVLDKEHGLRK